MRWQRICLVFVQPGMCWRQVEHGPITRIPVGKTRVEWSNGVNALAMNCQQLCFEEQNIQEKQ